MRIIFGKKKRIAAVGMLFLFILIAGAFWEYATHEPPPKQTISNPIKDKPLVCGLFPPHEVINLANKPLSEIGEYFPREERIDRKGSLVWDDIPGTCRLRTFNVTRSSEVTIISIRYDFLNGNDVPLLPLAANLYSEIKNDINRVPLSTKIGEGYYSTLHGAHFTLPCEGKEGALYVQLAYGEEAENRSLGNVEPVLRVLSDNLRKHPDCE